MSELSFTTDELEIIKIALKKYDIQNVKLYKKIQYRIEDIERQIKTEQKFYEYRQCLENKSDE